MATLSTSLHCSSQSVAASSIALPLCSTFHLRSEICFSSHRRRLSPLFFSSNSYAESVVCSAAVRPPPDSDPPPEEDPVRLTGLPAIFSKFRDRVQIFLAVLFWMSLFFWTSALDGRNRPNKGSRFRR